MTSPNRDDYKQLWKQAQQTGRLQLRTELLGDLLKEQFLPDVWIVDQLIPDKSVTILSGSPGSFKTWIYMEMAVKIANGQQALGHFDTKHTGVLVIDEESGRQRLQRRFKQLGATEATPIHFTSRTGYKMNQLFVEAIIEEAKELGIGLIIFDSFTRFTNTGADENASGDMSVLMDCYRQLADAGFSVLILHHNRKEVAGQFNPAQAMRGSSDILAAVDCHIAVSRVGQSEFVKLIQTKNRDIWEPVPFELRFHENATEFEFVGESKSLTEKHKDRQTNILNRLFEKPGLSKRQLVLEVKTFGIDVGEKKISDLIDELEAAGEITKQLGSRNSYLYYLGIKSSTAKVQ